MTDSTKWAVSRFIGDDEQIIGYFSSFERASEMVCKLYESCPNMTFTASDKGGVSFAVLEAPTALHQWRV